MSVLSQVPGLPGMRAAKTVLSRMVTRGGWIPSVLPQGRVIAGACSRDTGNSPTTRLQAGLLMGKISTVINSLGTVGYYAPSVIGVTGGALAGTATSLTLSAAVGAEVLRRCGATGSITLTGPPTASGTVRQLTVAYSAFSGTTLTITAPGVNEVQTVTFAIASTGGNVALELWDPRTNNYVQVAPAAWSATDATYLSNIQAQLDLAFGAANIVVVSAKSATDTDSALVFTYSGTGVAGLPIVDANGTAKLPIVTTLPTSSTSYATQRTTAGVDGRFVSGSLVGSTDGTQNPLTFIPNGTPLLVADYDGNNIDVEFAEIPVDCIVDETMLLPAWPSDTSLQAWIKGQLSTTAGGKFIFSGTF